MAFAHTLLLLLLVTPTALPAAGAEPLPAPARPGSAVASVSARAPASPADALGMAPGLALTPALTKPAMTILAQAEGPPGAVGGDDPPPPPPWFDEVRNQRRALQDLRRAKRDAEKDARLDDFLRRRQQRRDQVELDRRLFLNWGPWLEPLGSYPSAFPGPANPDSQAPPGTAAEGLQHPPPGWDNRWYYNGW